jgi:hypothetical protein
MTAGAVLFGRACARQLFTYYCCHVYAPYDEVLIEIDLRANCAKKSALDRGESTMMATTIERVTTASRFPGKTIGLLFVAWLIAAGTGFAILIQYKATPGGSAVPPAHWPEGTPFRFASPGKTLVMFAHPKCGCTRATFNELARVLAKSDGQLAIHIVFARPAGAGPDWNKTDIVQSASRLPGAQVYWDDAGHLAGLFHAETSGYALLYDERGSLLFSGGITASRGHEGINEGRLELLQQIAGTKAPAACTPVFGCPLYESSAAPPAGPSLLDASLCGEE